MKRLTTTSFQILSLLAIRSWSGYELAQQMRRNAGMFWPRAERGVYDEPRSLVEHGLAEGVPELVGRRPRTVYRITPAGRAALRDWLATPMDVPVAFESEAIVRVGCAENGSTEALLATLAGLREQLAQQRAFTVQIAREYAEGEARYPERVHLIALVARFFADYVEAFDSWADWATEQARGWPDVSAPPDQDAARAIFTEIVERLDFVAQAR